MKRGPPGVVAELAAQVPYVHLEDVLVTLEVEPPGGVEELLPGEHDAWVTPERVEENELEGGQLHRGPADGDLAARRVDDEVGHVDHAFSVRPWSGALSPQERLNPRHELARGERLGEVVVAANLEAHDPVDLLGPCREEDDKRIGEGPDAEEDLEPVEPGQHDVEDHDVGQEGADLLDRVRPVGGLGNRHPLSLQEPPNDRTDRRLVVDDEHACRAVGRDHGRNRRRCQPTTVIVPRMPAS